MKSQFRFALMPLILALCASVVRAQTAPTNYVLPVASSYLGFVASDNTDTLDSSKRNPTRDKLGRPMDIHSVSEALERETKNGYATMFAASASTTLRVPLGWFGVDYGKNEDESLVFSPGLSIQIVAREAMKELEFNTDRDAFAKLRKRSVTQTRARLEAQGLSVGPIERTDFPDGAFAVRALEITDKAKHTFSYIEHFSQRATPTERDDWWAKRALNDPFLNLPILPLPISMSMFSPADKFEKYLPLFGLMVRDQGLKWKKTEQHLTPDEFWARTPDAARFNAVADEAVALLKSDDIKAFRARFPTAFEEVQEQEIEPYLHRVMVPRLKNLVGKTARVEVTVESDRDPRVPLFRVTIGRYFELDEGDNAAYFVTLERVGGAIELGDIRVVDIPRFIQVPK